MRQRMLKRKPHHQRLGARSKDRRKTRRREPAFHQQNTSRFTSQLATLIKINAPCNLTIIRRWNINRAVREGTLFRSVSGVRIPSPDPPQGLFRPGVPGLTGSADIKLNTRLSLRASTEKITSRTGYFPDPPSQSRRSNIFRPTVLFETGYRSHD
jgi:hypothetical protein